MCDIEIAKQYLKDDNTCVLIKGEKSYISQKSGIAPMLDFIAKGVDLEGFSVADKIVGKAAAMLFKKAKIKEVYAETVSKAGLEYLEQNGIKVSYGLCVDVIINRQNTGMCPMEQTVLNIEDFEEGYRALVNKVNELKKGEKK